MQRTELEHADFAQRAPSLPGWTDWSAVPGDVRTDAKPNACVDSSGNLHLFVKGINEREAEELVEQALNSSLEKRQRRIAS